MENDCKGRREFLVKTTATVGGLVLSLAGIGAAEAKTAEGDDFTIKLDEKSPLRTVGGSYTFDYKGDKVIVVRNSETEFKAYSAICTHKGGTVAFDAKTSQFKCPLHSSKFAIDGSNAGGPAKQPLRSFETSKAVVVSLKI